MELTLTAENFHTLGKSIAQQLGASLGSTLEISDMEDGSLRVCTKNAKDTLTTEELVRELERETVSGMVPCRVMLLEARDKSESVKVWISAEHGFPLKAEFFKSPEDKKPFRLMEANGFTKKNGLYYAKTILIEGPGWRTKVEFFPDFVELGLYDKSNPVNVFLPVR